MRRVNCTGVAKGVNGLMLGLALLGASVLLVACGGSSGDETTSAAAGDETSAASGLVGEACTEAKQAEAPVKFVGPGEPFDSSGAKGKTVWWINFGITPTGEAVTNGAIEAGEILGFDVKQFNGQSDPSAWNRGVEQAVNQQANAIVLLGINANLVEEGLAKAKTAGIPVIEVTAPDPVETGPGVSAAVGFDYGDAGKMIANYVVCEHDGKVDGTVIADATFAQSAKIEAGYEEVFSKCDECQVSVANIPLENWPKDLSTNLKTTVLKEPDLNMAFPLFDYGAPFAATALAEAGATGRVSLVSINGEPSSLDLICKEEQSATAAQPSTWSGWAAADQIARMLVGAPAVDEKIPNRLLTEENLSCPAPKSQTEELFGETDFRQGYQELWSEAG